MDFGLAKLFDPDTGYFKNVQVLHQYAIDKGLCCSGAVDIITLCKQPKVHAATCI